MVGAISALYQGAACAGGAPQWSVCERPEVRQFVTRTGTSTVGAGSAAARPAAGVCGGGSISLDAGGVSGVLVCPEPGNQTGGVRETFAGTMAYSQALAGQKPSLK